jgi:hypothetical protein
LHLKDTFLAAKPTKFGIKVWERASKSTLEKKKDRVVRTILAPELLSEKLLTKATMYIWITFFQIQLYLKSLQKKLSIAVALLVGIEKECQKL